MVNFLGPSYGVANADNDESFFNEVVAYEYSYDDNYDGITSLPLRQTSNDQKVSMMFVLSTARTISSIDVWMRMQGTIPSGTMTITIHPETSLGVPDLGTTLATSSGVDVSELPIGVFDKVNFPVSVALSAGTNYYIVISSTASVDASNYTRIASDSTPVGYLRSATYNGAAWSVKTYHSCFIVYYETTVPLAQSFKVVGDQELDSIIIYASKVSAVAGNVTAEIYTDDDGVPSSDGVDNGVSAVVAATDFPSTIDAVTFTFSPRPQLSDGQTYHIVIRPTGTFTDSVYLQWGVDRSSPAFTSGNVSVGSPDGVWRSLEEDACFEVYYLEQEAPSTIGDALAELGDPPVDCRAQQVWLKSLISTLSSFYPSILPPLYGGTGAGSYDVGDMLYASAPYHLERLSIGSPGQALGINSSGLPAWGVGGESLAATLQNDSGVTLSAGDVVVYALTIGTPKSVTLTTKIADRLFAGVVQEPIAAGESGVVLLGGITQVRIQGSVTRGDFLDTSTTSRRAYSTTFGPMRALQSGTSGQLIYAYVNPVVAPLPYSRFSEVQAFNVNSSAAAATTWTACPLNTTEFNSHSGLYSLAANALTFVQTGTYRVSGMMTITLAGAGTTPIAGRIQKTSGTPATLLVGQSMVLMLSGSLLLPVNGEIAITAGDVIQLQAQCSNTFRFGTAHGIAGNDNRYGVLEIVKVKDS